MSEIKGFSFYKSYYDCLKDLKEKDQFEILKAMLKFVFDDEKIELKGIKKSIFALIEPNLQTSKNRSNLNAGAPSGNKNALKYGKNQECKNNQKTIKKQSKNNQKTINGLKDISLSLSLSLSSSLSSFIFNSSIKDNKDLIKIFEEYIKLRKDKKYVINDTVINRLLNKLDNAGSDEERKEMMEQALIGGWKDFYPVTNKSKINDKKSTKLEDGAFKL